MAMGILLLSCRATSTTPSCTTAAIAMKPCWVWGSMTCSSPISLPFQSTWFCVALFSSSGRLLLSFFSLPCESFLAGILLSHDCPFCSMAQSFKKNYVLSDRASNSAWQVLCSWDFSITNERAITQRKNNLSVQLKVGSDKPGVQHKLPLLLILLFPICNHSGCHFLHPYISIFLSLFPPFLIFPGVFIRGSPGDVDSL